MGDPSKKERFQRLDAIAAKLRERQPDSAASTRANQHAAVAIILRESPQHGVEALFIERAEHPHDPWSGQMAFPGGRREPSDPSLEAAARRETFEEVGILLEPEMLIGQLDDVAGGRLTNLDLSVTPYVYAGPSEVTVTPNHEVSSVVWIPLARLSSPENVTPYYFPPDPDHYPFPSFRHGRYIIWGLTYRMLASFMRVFGVTLPLDLRVSDVE